MRAMMMLTGALLCAMSAGAWKLTDDGRLQFEALDGDAGVLDFVCEGDQLRAELRYEGCLGAPGAVSVVEMKVHGGVQALQRWTFDAEGEALTFDAGVGIVQAVADAQVVTFDSPREGGRAVTRFDVEGVAGALDQLPCYVGEGDAN